jgi:hypothetical protein
MFKLTKKQIKANPNNELRLRVMRVMAELPKHWLEPYLELYPSENNRDGITKIRNIAAMRSFDTEKVEQLETLEQHLKNS